MNEDIEKLKQDLKQAELAYQMAAQLSQFKTGFLARTAHELRSPLTSLMGIHQIILAELCESAEEEREFIAQGYQVAQKLMNIIDQIVNVSKLEYGGIKLDIQPLQLAKVLTELQDLTGLQAANRNLKLEITAPKPEIHVLADNDRLLLVLVMLIDTAINSIEGGKIKIAAQVSDLVEIKIDIPASSKIWQQSHKLPQLRTPLTLATVKTFSQELEMSPPMKILLAQSLLEVMGGKLEIGEISPISGQQTFTRLQCSLLAKSPEVPH